MSTQTQADPQVRVPLTRLRVLLTAVDLADRGGVEALSMRKLAQALDVVPMALYRHVTNKEELLDGMDDVVVGEVDPPLEGAGWKTAMRERILSARRALADFAFGNYRYFPGRPHSVFAELSWLAE